MKLSYIYMLSCIFPWQRLVYKSVIMNDGLGTIQQFLFSNKLCSCLSVYYIEAFNLFLTYSSFWNVYLLTSVTKFLCILAVNHSAVHQTNPWGTPSPVHSGNLATVDVTQGRASPSTNPFLGATSSTQATVPSGAITNTMRPMLQDHTRSHSMDSSTVASWQHPNKRTLLEMAHHQSFQSNGNSTAENVWPTNTDWASSFSQTSTTNTTTVIQNQSNNAVKTEDSFDPFDVAWAAKNSGKAEDSKPQSNNVSNPFATKTVTTYKVELWWQQLILCVVEKYFMWITKFCI